MPSKKDLSMFLGEFGEITVAYELMKRGWDVMRHLGGQGFDLHATKGTVIRYIEVKTVDPWSKIGASKRQLTATYSPSEIEKAGFLIFYIHSIDIYYIIPSSAFPSSRSITVFIGKDGKIGTRTKYEPYRNNWELLN